MEAQLFSWDGWDVVDTMFFQFYNVILKKDIGEHKIGDKFSWAALDYEKGRLTLGTEEDGDLIQEYHFKLWFTITPWENEEES